MDRGRGDGRKTGQRRSAPGPCRRGPGGGAEAAAHQRSRTNGRRLGGRRLGTRGVAARSPPPRAPLRACPSRSSCRPRPRPRTRTLFGYLSDSLDSFRGSSRAASDAVRRAAGDDITGTNSTLKARCLGRATAPCWPATPGRLDGMWRMPSARVDRLARRPAGCGSGRRRPEAAGDQSGSAAWRARQMARLAPVSPFEVSVGCSENPTPRGGLGVQGRRHGRSARDVKGPDAVRSREYLVLGAVTLPVRRSGEA